MTITEAADYLNVSQTWIKKLIEDDILLVTENRLDTDVLIAYRQYRDVKRAKLLDEMARFDQETGAYD